MKIEGLDKLRRLAADVRRIPDAATRAATRSVNAVASKVATQARRDISAQINLPQSYIANQMRTTPATAWSMP